MARGSDDILRVYTPELPNLGTVEGPRDEQHDREDATDPLANAVFLDNCADRLTSFGDDVTNVRLKVLDAVTMSLDGLTYRLTLRKGTYFHCGAEATAADAVETILRVLRQRDSASQLHRAIAREGGRFAVQAVSRYRFEIRLTRRLPDLLLRLALPEMSLRHGGRACFSGLWKVEGKDESGLLLSVHEKHPDAGDCAYSKLRWQRLIAMPELGPHADEGAYLYLYPGTLWKSPPEELLTDELCRAMPGRLSLLWKVNAPAEVRAELKLRLAAAARACFGKSSLWRRAPLTSLLPKGHVLDAPLQLEPSIASDRRLSVALVAADPALPRQIWEQFRQVAAAEARLDIELPQADGHGAASPNHPRGPIAELRPVFCAHPADYCTPLAPLADETHVAFGREAEFCRELTRRQDYAPFLAVPFMLRSNRTLRPQDATGLIQFSGVRPSSDSLRGRRMQDAALKALGAGLQMFVHDVKRPFSMLQGVLSLLEAAQSPDRLREITGKYLPEVRRAADAAGGLIQDILEIGSDAEPSCEDVSLYGLLADVLREIFTLRPRASAGISLSYHFQHQRKLFVDPQKLGRAVSNIVLNAVEAMGAQGGDISFHTRETPDQSSLTLTIANTGSFIAPERLAGLFDQFFTEGKKHGTGLGLAIVKKIVTDHDGEVSCESSEAEGVRFHLTLPLAQTVDPPPGSPLPSCAAALAPPARIGSGAGDDAATDASNANLARDELAQLLQSGKSGGMRVLVVDDNPLYLEATRELLTPAERDEAAISFTFAADARTALTLVGREAFDVAIVDVDLGPAGDNGLELVRRLRALPQRPTVRADEAVLKICVHSNGPPFELQRRAIEAGADLFLPKPMTRDHLVRLLAAPMRRRTGAILPRIAVVDDDALALETWEAQPGYSWLSYGSPGELLAACDADPALLPSLYCVITDFTFSETGSAAGAPNGACLDGFALASELRRRHQDLQVFLATDRPMPSDPPPPGIRAVIAKDAGKGIVAIAQALGELASRR